MGPAASGEYLIDTLAIGGGTISQVQFGLATASNFDNVGILGVGFGYPWNLNYYGVIDQLRNDFGGIDTMKYIGSLYKSPMISAANSPDGSALPVCRANVKWGLDCRLRFEKSSGTIDFGFGTKIIHVNFYDWIWQVGSTTCIFGARPSDDDFVLGDPFMQSVCFVYDQDNFNFHIAQAADCGTNMVAIGKGVNAVPSIVGACIATTSTSSSKISSSASIVKTTSTSSSKTASTTGSKVSSASSAVKTTSSTPKKKQYKHWQN
ncbi:acid protease [Acephala macrosclerotiorum]|nr:acid protease [Acephala macrosclerotiorum]